MLLLARSYAFSGEKLCFAPRKAMLCSPKSIARLKSL